MDNQYPVCIIEHLQDMNVEAVIVAQGGSIDTPAGYVVTKTEYLHGKRIRTIERVKDI